MAGVFFVVVVFCLFVCLFVLFFSRFDTENKHIKSRNSYPGQVLLDFILFFNIAVEKFFKKINLVKLELSKEISLSPEYPDFGSKF